MECPLCGQVLEGSVCSCGHDSNWDPASIDKPHVHAGEPPLLNIPIPPPFPTADVQNVKRKGKGLGLLGSLVMAGLLLGGIMCLPQSFALSEFQGGWHMVGSKRMYVQVASMPSSIVLETSSGKVTCRPSMPEFGADGKRTFPAECSGYAPFGALFMLGGPRGTSFESSKTTIEMIKLNSEYMVFKFSGNASLFSKSPKTYLEAKSSISESEIRSIAQISPELAGSLEP